MTIRIAIIQFPGSECTKSIAVALSKAGMQPVDLVWDASSDALTEFSGFVIADGASFSHEPRPAVMAALTPIVHALKQQDLLGKPILGIGNGAHILLAAGLVPGLMNYQLGGALLSGSAAHEFYFPPALLNEMRQNGQVIFEFENSITGISNKAGNILAILPHPAVLPQVDVLLQKMRVYIEKGYVQKVNPMYYHPRFSPIKNYILPPNTAEHLVEQPMQYSNVLENLLTLQGIQCRITCYRHEEVLPDSSLSKKLLPVTHLFTQTFLIRSHFKKGMLFHINYLSELTIHPQIFYNPYIEECFYY